jgi:RimJ/RimL family protein N-acetyltransferase
MREVASLGPRSLTGRFIALEPMDERHHAGLITAAADPETWRYIPFDMSEGYAARIPDFEREMEKGRQLTFVVRQLSDGEIVGSTSYLAIAADQARVEIGATWYVASARGGAVNPETKYLLLQNAFAAGYNRVEFKTDSKNARSRAALTKLGAKEEGTLRGHMWMPQGYFRDSVYFSILASEWPDVKAKLEKRLDAY